MLPKKLTLKQKSAVLSTISSMLYQFARRYGNSFHQKGVCIKSSLAFSKALRRNKIPHKRVYGGEAAGINWHCWVELPEIGIVDFCAGQADGKADDWVDVVIGQKSGRQTYDETSGQVTEYYT